MTSCTRSRPCRPSGWLLLVLASAVSAQQPTAPAALAEMMVVEGRVVDMLGDPVPAASVWVVDPREPDERLARSVADGDGVFRLGRVPMRTVLHVHATAPGHCIGAAPASPSPLLLRLQQATRVTGILRNRAGIPVIGAVVRADVCSGVLRDVASLATTDRDGKFELRDVPFAPIRCRAWVPLEGVAEAFLAVSLPGTVALRAPAEASTTLSIRVQGLPEDAVDEVFVDVRTRDDRGDSRLPPPYTFPKYRADGLRLVQIPAWKYETRLQAREWTFQTDSSNPCSVLATAVARIGGDVVFRATVVDAGDRPIAGVPFALVGPSGVAAHATSDLEGRLAITGPFQRLQTHRLRSLHAAWTIESEVTDRRSAASDPAGNLQVVLDPDASVQVRACPTCSIRGRLLGPDGRPAQFVAVAVQRFAEGVSPPWWSLQEATTDLDGRFELRIRHQDASLRIASASPDGHASTAAFALTDPGQEHDVDRVQLAAATIVEGVVRDRQKRPAPGTRVWLRSIAADSVRNPLQETLTDASGRFRFRGVASTAVDLLLPEADAWSRSVLAHSMDSVTEGKTHVVILELPRE